MPREPERLNTGGPVEVFRKCLGLDLTPTAAQHITDVDERSISELVQALAQHYNSMQPQPSTGTEAFCLIDTSFGDLSRVTAMHKSALLYLEHVVVKDPVADVIWSIQSASALLQFAGGAGIHLDASVRERLALAYGDIAALLALYEGGHCSIEPIVYQTTPEQVQTGSSRHLASRAKPPEDLFLAVPELAVWGVMCQGLNWTPVPTGPSLKRALEWELAQAEQVFAASSNGGGELRRWPLDALQRFALPGAEQVDLQTIVRVRSDDEHFAALRRNLSQLLRSVRQAKPTSEAAFKIEFADAAEELLGPAIRDIEKRARTASAWTSVLVPAACGLAGAAVGLAFARDPAAGLLGSLATSSTNWLVRRIAERRSARASAALVDIYLCMLGRPKANKQ